MRIAIPVKMNKENPPLAPLFGKAKWFAIIENGEISIIPNNQSGGGALDLIRHIRKNMVMYKAQAALFSCFSKIPLAAFMSLSTIIVSSRITFFPPSLESIVPSQERVLEV
jgi:hypothetical protein